LLFLERAPGIRKGFCKRAGKNQQKLLDKKKKLPEKGEK
jgi:hypothetical protein